MAVRYDATAAPITRVGGRYRAKLARSGGQTYDGGRVEWRDPQDVFDVDSLASLVGVRVQIDHTQGAPQVGVVEQPIRRVLDGGFEHIEAALRIDDAATRARIDAGQLREISMGYAVELDETPGVAPDGTRYHARQRRIVYDHAALLEPGRARCGATCSITGRADSLQPRKQSAMSDPSRPCSCSRTDVVAPLFAPLAGTFGEVRTDAAVESRIDALSAAARVDAADVRRALLERTTRSPSEREIEEAIHTVRLAAHVRREKYR